MISTRCDKNFSFRSSNLRFPEKSPSSVGLSRLRLYGTYIHKSAPSIMILRLWSSSYHRAHSRFDDVRQPGPRSFFPSFSSGFTEENVFFEIFDLSRSHDQNPLECVSRIKYLTWLASVFRWRWKCWFITLSRVPSAPFARPASQRRH